MSGYPNILRIDFLGFQKWTFFSNTTNSQDTYINRKSLASAHLLMHGESEPGQEE